MEAGQVVLLVRRMDAVVVEREADQDRLGVQHLAEVPHDRDRPARAGEDRRFRPFVAERRLRGPEFRAVGGHDRGPSALAGVEVEREIRRKPVAQETLEIAQDRLGVLVAHEPEGELGRGLRGQHRLAAGADIAAPDAVALGGRAGPDLLEHRIARLAARLAEADLAQERRVVEGQRIPCGLHVVGHGMHAVVELGDGDPPGVVVDVGDHAADHPDRVQHRPAIHARMQIAGGALHGELGRGEAAQHGGDLGGLRVEQVRVTDQREIRLELVPVLGQEGNDRGRAAFLLAFEQDRQVAGQAARDRLPGAERLDEGHQLALVVAGAAGADHLAGRSLLDRRVEGVALPQLERVDRLHVIMAVNQQMRPVALVMRHHHRLARRVAPRGVEAETRKLGHQPVGRGLAVGVIGRIGRDRGDPEQLEQALERRVQSGVNGFQDLVE